MTAFALARRLRAGELVYSGWCSLGAPIVAETVARQGFAAVNIDQQHGLGDFAATVAAISAIAAAGSAPIVRVPLADFATASRALDCGAQAIIAPMINTVSDAKAFVAATKYPPLGERSWGPNRAMTLQDRTDAVDYLREANDGTLTLAMIETKTALANVDAIAATPGIDALFVGPYDLATALSGGKAQDVTAPEVEREIDRVCAAAIKAGKIPGVYCRDAERALDMKRRGFRFIAVGNDLGFLRDGIAPQMKLLKG
ncbi:MAG TPA: aldolase/citrate lyase family protein [Pseudolabrys sp.]|nr:aldolase/citrate lyase family protein [Pseudolabrys sp.]